MAVTDDNIGWVLDSVRRFSLEETYPLLTQTLPFPGQARGSHRPLSAGSNVWSAARWC